MSQWVVAEMRNRLYSDTSSDFYDILKLVPLCVRSSRSCTPQRSYTGSILLGAAALDFQRGRDSLSQKATSTEINCRTRPRSDQARPRYPYRGRVLPHHTAQPARKPAM
jgi:hypothetical protein